MKTGRADAAAHRPRHGKKARTVMQNIYRFADHTIEIESLYPLVHELCAAYQTEESGAEYSVRITEEDILSERASLEAAWRQSGYDPRRFSARYLETLAVYRKIAEALLPCDILLMHGSVVAVDGRAYLFTAKSGTGKTTHTRLWLRQFGERAVVVNGDKPLLHIERDSVTVYGTQWDGKEHMSRNISCPLMGVCILTRSTVNRIEPLSRRDAMPHLCQQTYRPSSPAALGRTLALIDHLSRSVPLYLLGCNMEPEAARVAYNGMRQQEDQAL